MRDCSLDLLLHQARQAPTRKSTAVTLAFLNLPSPTPFLQISEMHGCLQANTEGTFLERGTKEEASLFFHNLKVILKNNHRPSEEAVKSRDCIVRHGDTAQSPGTGTGYYVCQF